MMIYIYYPLGMCIRDKDEKRNLSKLLLWLYYIAWIGGQALFTLVCMNTQFSFHL